MKVNINGYEVEGTAQELQKLLSISKPAKAYEAKVTKLKMPRKKRIPKSSYAKWTKKEHELVKDGMKTNAPIYQIKKALYDITGKYRTPASIYNAMARIKNGGYKNGRK